MIFAPPHYLSRVKGYSQLLLCEAPKWVTMLKSKNFYQNAEICLLSNLMGQSKQDTAHLDASHRKNWEYPFVPLTQYGGTKIMKRFSF